MKKIYFLFVLLCLVLSNQNFAQSSDAALEIVGYTKEKGKDLKGVTVIVYDGNTVLETKKTVVGGRFVFHLPFGKKYKIVIEKEGFINMFFNVDGVVADGESLENMTTDLDIKMVKQPMDGTSYTYTKPVAKVFYQDKIGEFDYDWDHDDLISNELRVLQKKIDEKDKIFQKENKDKLDELAKAEYDKEKAIEEERRLVAEEEKNLASAALAAENKKAKEAKRLAAEAKAKSEAQTVAAGLEKRKKEEELKAIKADEEAAKSDANRAKKEAEAERDKREEEGRKLAAERLKAEEAAQKVEDEKKKLEEEKKLTEQAAEAAKIAKEEAARNKEDAIR